MNMYVNVTFADPNSATEFSLPYALMLKQLDKLNTLIQKTQQERTDLVEQAGSNIGQCAGQLAVMENTIHSAKTKMAALLTVLEAVDRTTLLVFCAMFGFSDVFLIGEKAYANVGGFFVEDSEGYNRLFIQAGEEYNVIDINPGRVRVQWINAPTLSAWVDASILSHLG